MHVSLGARPSGSLINHRLRLPHPPVTPKPTASQSDPGNYSGGGLSNDSENDITEPAAAAEIAGEEIAVDDSLSGSALSTSIDSNPSASEVRSSS